MFDNGRLKTANYSTDQGFGLRAVAGEAAGYAHSSELSEAALLPRRRRGFGCQDRLFRHAGRSAAAHQPPSLQRREPDRLALLRGEGEAAAGDRRASEERRPARAAGDGLARRLLAACRDRARRRPDRARHPPAGAHERFGRGRRRRPAGKRLVRRGRPQGFWRVRRRGQLETRSRRGAAAGAGEP